MENIIFEIQNNSTTSVNVNVFDKKPFGDREWPKGTLGIGMPSLSNNALTYEQFIETLKIFKCRAIELRTIFGMQEEIVLFHWGEAVADGINYGPLEYIGSHSNQLNKNLLEKWAIPHGSNSLYDIRKETRFLFQVPPSTTKLLIFKS